MLWEISIALQSLLTSTETLNAQVDQLGLLNTINLRQEFGGFQQPVNSAELVKPDKGGLYDEQYWQAAINSLSSFTPKSIPEPNCVLGLLALGALRAASMLKCKMTKRNS